MSSPERVNPDDTFDHAPFGYAVVGGNGVITRANGELLRIVHLAPEAVEATRTLSSLLSRGGQVFLETHVRPLLERDGVVREVAADVVRPDGTRVPVLLNLTLQRTSDGRPSYLVAMVETRDRHRFEADLLAATRAAEEAGQRAASLARTLQQTLVPPSPPSIPHLDVATVYRPAGTGHEVGGDFYDIFQVSEHSWLVVIGDVSGKGIPAATVTSFVRYTIRSLAIAHRDPSDLLQHLDLAMRRHQTERYCTLVIVRLDWRTSGWEIQLSLAGHPPAIVRHRDGQVSELGEFGTPVGLLDIPFFTTVHHRLRGETITLYTDGVTEARSDQGMFGDERLLTLIADGPADVHETANAVAHAALAFQDNLASDDIAVVSFASDSTTA